VIDRDGGLLLGSIADDVTGASDLASMLTREGMRTVQTIGVPDELDPGDVDAVVIALKSRTAPVADAVRESVAALRWLQERGARQYFFKYCSTFDSTPKGNIGPVADALLEQLGVDVTVVCPAYPANDRTVYQGHLFVGDRLLSESTMATHPLTPMTDANLVRTLRRQTRREVGLIPYEIVVLGRVAIERQLAELRRDGVSYAVVDALEDTHLREIGAACAGLALVTGGSGVAMGLPMNFRERRLLPDRTTPISSSPPGGPSLVLAGSCSEITNEQVRRMSTIYPAIRVDALEACGRDAAATVAAEVTARLADGPVLVYTTAPPDEVAHVQERLGAARASATLELLLGEVARRSVEFGVRRLIVAGGETSAAVLNALGIRALSVGREIAPGVPWMTSLGDPRLEVALKSGNFGGPDFFLEALADAR
jgi:uncharacterized protein YgbK (DUF1537 family)